MSQVSHRRRLPRLVLAITALSALIAAGCAGASSPSPDVYSLHMRMTPSNVAWVVAQEEGLFEGIDLDWELVGYGESAQLFVAGTDPVGQESPWEAARFQAEGDIIAYFGTAGALNFFNGVIVRTEDAEKYKEVPDLVGQKFGIPGFGSGTYQAFEIIANSIWGINAREDFELIEADPGALVGLLETGEIDAMINFTGQTALALTQPEVYTSILNTSDLWKEEHGANLVINGPMARREWLDENQDVAKRLLEGVDAGVQWLKDNPETIDNPDGKYANITEGEGWYQTPETTELIMDLFQNGEYYFTNDLYTQEWIDGVYEFIELGKGVFADEIPAKDSVFYYPTKSE
jgi:ABC-type nitrate/sulfonate/bicarbonate transport system substrate-binding protein